MLPQPIPRDSLPPHTQPRCEFEHPEQRTFEPPERRNFEEARRNFEPPEARRDFDPSERRGNFEPAEARRDFQPTDIRRNFEPSEVRPNFGQPEQRQGFERPDEFESDSPNETQQAEADSTIAIKTEPVTVKEEPGREESGVFGGLVSYFSSQHEDDIDA